MNTFATCPSEKNLAFCIPCCVFVPAFSPLSHIPCTWVAFVTCLGSLQEAWATLLTALTCISSQVEGNVTVQKTIFLQFIFVVQVIDFKFLQVNRGLGSPIPLNTLYGKKERLEQNPGLVPARWDQPAWLGSVPHTSCILASKVQM